MKVFYGDRKFRIHDSPFSHAYRERGYMFFNEDEAKRISLHDMLFYLKPKQSEGFLKGFIQGSRGMRGYDIRVLRELLAFCKEKGYDEVVEYIEYKIERM